MAKSSSPARNVSKYAGPMVRRKPSDRPVNPSLGEFFREDGQIVVHVGRGTWAFFPAQCDNLIKVGRAHGWGAKLYRVPTQSYVGMSATGDMLMKPIVRIILLLGREAGPTKNGGQSKGYTYRLMWDTHETGSFKLVSKYRRTTTDPAWVELGSMYEIRSIVTRFPVITEGADNAETDSQATGEANTEDAGKDRPTVPVGEDGA